MSQNTGRTKTLTVFSTLAVRAPFDNGVMAEYDKADRLHFEWSPTTVIESKIADGQHADLVIATDGAIARMVEAGVLREENCFPLVTAYFGVAVPRGHVKPDISTKQAFLNALTAARSVAYSLGGASGIYLQDVMKDNGIFHDVEPKATKIAQGFTAEHLVDGKADLAVQQMSELMVVDGIDIVGPFPDEVQQLTPFTIAIVNGCEQRDVADDFIDYLLNSQCRETYLQNGLQCR